MVTKQNTTDLGPLLTEFCEALLIVNGSEPNETWGALSDSEEENEDQKGEVQETTEYSPLFRSKVYANQEQVGSTFPSYSNRQLKFNETVNCHQVCSPLPCTKCVA